MKINFFDRERNLVKVIQIEIEGACSLSDTSIFLPENCSIKSIEITAPKKKNCKICE